MVASTRGYTGVRAAEVLLPGRNLVVVTRVAGFRSQGQLELLPENRERIEELGERFWW